MAARNSIQTLLQSLPQELYDKIYEDVFSIEPGERIVDDRYKPPAQLQVNRVTRERFAKSYYGNGSTFVFPQGLVRNSIEVPSETAIRRAAADYAGVRSGKRTSTSRRGAHSTPAMDPNDLCFKALPKSHFVMITSLSFPYPTDIDRNYLVTSMIEKCVAHEINHRIAFSRILMSLGYRESPLFLLDPQGPWTFTSKTGEQIKWSAKKDSFCSQGVKITIQYSVSPSKSSLRPNEKESWEEQDWLGSSWAW